MNMILYFKRLISRSHHDKINVAGWYNRLPVNEEPSLIAHRNPVEHKRRRKLWDRAFSTIAIKNYDDIVVRKASELVEQLEKRVGQEIDLSMWMSYFACVASLARLALLNHNLILVQI